MLAKRIRNTMFARDITLTQLAQRLKEKYGKERTVQNLSQKFRKDNLNEKEILEIVDCLGWELRFELVDKATGEVL